MTTDNNGHAPTVSPGSRQESPVHHRLAAHGQWPALVRLASLPVPVTNVASLEKVLPGGHEVIHTTPGVFCGVFR